VQNNEVDLTSKPGHYNGKSHQGQLLARPALGHQVNKYLSVWQACGWTPSLSAQIQQREPDLGAGNPAKTV